MLICSVVPKVYDSAEKPSRNSRYKSSAQEMHNRYLIHLFISLSDNICNSDVSVGSLIVIDLDNLVYDLSSIVHFKSAAEKTYTGITVHIAAYTMCFFNNPISFCFLFSHSMLKYSQIDFKEEK